MASLNIQINRVKLTPVMIVNLILRLILSGKSVAGDADGEIKITIKSKRKN